MLNLKILSESWFICINTYNGTVENGEKYKNRDSNETKKNKKNLAYIADKDKLKEIYDLLGI